MNCDSLDRHTGVYRENPMKKLMTILLALSFLGTTIALGFAQDTKKGTQNNKKNPPKKGSKKAAQKK